MIKFSGTDEHGRTIVVGLGLSFENLDRLRRGKPIKVKGHSIGINHDIYIFAGADNDVMAKQLKPVISARTVIKRG